MPFTDKNTLIFKVRGPHLFDIESYLITDDDLTTTSNDEKISESPEFDDSSREAIKNSKIPQEIRKPSKE